MEELENKVLDSLYEVREGEVEKKYIKKYGNPDDTDQKENAEDELINFIKRFIKKKKDIENLYEKLNKILSLELDALL